MREDQLTNTDRPVWIDSSLVHMGLFAFGILCFGISWRCFSSITRTP